MSAQDFDSNNNGNPEEKQSGRSPWLWGCGIGCAIMIVIVAVIGVFGYMKVKDLAKEIPEMASAIAGDLQQKGYVPYGEDINGKGVTDLVKMFQQNLNVDKKQTRNIYGIAASLTVNAPCDKDVLFVGKTLTIAQPVNGNVCFLGGKDSTLTITATGKVKKVFVPKEVQVINNGKIAEGVTHELDKFYDFTALEKAFSEKYGSQAVKDLKGQIEIR